MSLIKKPCGECKKMARTLFRRKNKLVCYQCSLKNVHLIRDYKQPNALVSLDKAISRIYEVKGYLNRRGAIQANMSVPSILIGHKIKLVLMDGKQ